MWHATMMTMMMMIMLTGILPYGTNTYRYSFCRYSVRHPWWRLWWWCVHYDGDVDDDDDDNDDDDVNIMMVIMPTADLVEWWVKLWCWRQRSFAEDGDDVVFCNENDVDDVLATFFATTNWPLQICQTYTSSKTNFSNKTLPKALRTQALTALTSSFGLVWWVWFGRFGLVGLVW